MEPSAPGAPAARIGSREGYDLWSRDYDAFENPMVALTAWVLDREPPAATGARVLEPGCGTGRNAPRLLGTGAAAYVGVDNSGGMLERARGRTADPRAAWVAATLGAPLPFADASFDLVLVALVLEHFESLGTIFAELGRALRPGGSLRVLEIHPDLVRGGTQAHFWHAGREFLLPSFPHGPDEFVAAADPAGLSVAGYRAWHADAAVTAAIPKLARHAGRAVLLDFRAHRRHSSASRPTS